MRLVSIVIENKFKFSSSEVVSGINRLNIRSLFSHDKDDESANKYTHKITHTLSDSSISQIQFALNNIIVEEKSSLAMVLVGNMMETLSALSWEILWDSIILVGYWKIHFSNEFSIFSSSFSPYLAPFTVCFLWRKSCEERSEEAEAYRVYRKPFVLQISIKAGFAAANSRQTEILHHPPKLSARFLSSHGGLARGESTTAVENENRVLFSPNWLRNFLIFLCPNQEPGRASPNGKILVKEAPEMLAISQWTGQIPNRPQIPEGCSVKQLIALGSRRKRSKVYWMLAQSEEEVGWVTMEN